MTKAKDEAKQLSSTFDQALYRERDLIESAAVHVLNWRCLRWFAALACAFWAVTMVTLLIPVPNAELWQLGSFFAGCLPAVAVIALREFERLRIKRKPIIHAISEFYHTNEQR